MLTGYNPISMPTGFQTAASTGSQILTPVGYAGFKEDFLGGSGSAAVTTSAATGFDVTWSAAQIVGGTQSLVAQNGTYANPGLTLWTTSAVSGQGVALSRGGGGGSAGPLGNLAAQGGWEVNIILALAATTLVCVRAGVCTGGQQVSDAPSGGIYVEYDTANVGNTNANFTYVTRSASSPTYSTTNSVAADTSFHKFRIRSVVAGTILFSTDNGTETAISATVPTTNMMAFIQLISRTTAAKAMSVDFYSYAAINTRV